MNDAKVDIFLAHYGVLGMKWGVRNDRKSNDQKSNDQKSNKAPKKLSLKNPKVKKAAIAGLGVTALVTSAFIASRFLDKPVNQDSIQTGKALADKLIKQPTDIIYLSKPGVSDNVTKNGLPSTTLRFISKGQTEDYFQVFDDAGLNSDSFAPGDFKKLTNGSVAAILQDLTGRVDTGGRSIPHAVFIPPDKAVGLNSIEDVVKKFGPELQRRYTEHMISARNQST